MKDGIGRAEIEPGVGLHYKESGAGIPIVFVHGLTGDLSSWDEQVPAFEKAYRTITYSRRFSRPNQNDLRSSPNHSVLVDATDLARLLGVLGAEPAVLVGSSYGAYTALALAMTQPTKVRAMVLCEPPVLSWADLVDGGRALREEFERATVYPARKAFENGDADLAAEIYARGVLGPRGTNGLTARARRLSNSQAIKALASSKREFVPLDPASASKLTMPILLISGEDTVPVFSSIFESARRLIPSASARKVANAGHSVYREQPSVFNKLCLEFLAHEADAAIRSLR
jgi:pimeloyl-ACP methyl ester carboxylesterase